MAEQAGERNSTGDALQKEIKRSEVFERKNAELEGVNDELRVENRVSLSYYNDANNVINFMIA